MFLYCLADIDENYELNKKHGEHNNESDWRFSDVLVIIMNNKNKS